MAICPECKIAIESLKCKTEAIMSYEVTLLMNSESLEFNDSEMESEEIVYFECYECNNIVAWSYSDAMEILRPK